MLNIEDTLRNLKKIKERSKEAYRIDDQISKRVENDIRMQIHSILKTYVDKIIDYGLRQAQISLKSDRNIVVTSDYQIQPSKKRGHFQSCASDDLVIIPFIQGGKKVWMKGDTKDRRFLFLDEFESRSIRLLEGIKEGILDHLLSEAPHELVHKIMGQKGELLQILGIESQQGSTYTRITNIIARQKVKE
jgi:sulfur carrier protein ThiS